MVPSPSSRAGRPFFLTPSSALCWGPDLGVWVPGQVVEARHPHATLSSFKL